MKITNPIRKWIKRIVIEAMDDRQREANIRYIDREIRVSWRDPMVRTERDSKRFISEYRAALARHREGRA